MSVLDRGGQMAGRAAVAALGRTPGTRLGVHISHTHLTLRAAIDTPLAVKDHRFLRLPALAMSRPSAEGLAEAGSS